MFDFDDLEFNAPGAETLQQVQFPSPGEYDGIVFGLSASEALRRRVSAECDSLLDRLKRGVLEEESQGASTPPIRFPNSSTIVGALLEDQPPDPIRGAGLPLQKSADKCQEVRSSLVSKDSSAEDLTISKEKQASLRTWTNEVVCSSAASLSDSDVVSIGAAQDPKPWALRRRWPDETVLLEVLGQVLPMHLQTIAASPDDAIRLLEDWGVTHASRLKFTAQVNEEDSHPRVLSRRDSMLPLPPAVVKVEGKSSILQMVTLALTRRDAEAQSWAAAASEQRLQRNAGHWRTFTKPKGAFGAEGLRNAAAQPAPDRYGMQAAGCIWPSVVGQAQQNMRDLPKKTNAPPSCS
ncbi:unnamed protein product [Polarella glacialis]|uniref:Uncharacterized protein n=1 Tax=Polarella glacialis TaxID=89957 RepID=A0A813DV43_POLGL|nr:unnamed protein product [Polarella glacialis]CAE8675977.1 unnamed protein product [Polarella glacialis]